MITHAPTTHQPGDVVGTKVLDRNGIWRPVRRRRDPGIFAMFALFLGGLGAHRLYVGQYAQAALYFVGTLVIVLGFWPLFFVTCTWMIVDAARCQTFVDRYNG